MDSTGTNITPEVYDIYDCIVIGGGISGVTFAHYLHTEGKKVLIIEKEDRIGGCMQTNTSSIDHNYWNELGSHTCYNSYVKLLSIVKELGLEDSVLPLYKCNYVAYNSNEIHSIVSQLSILPIIFRCWNFFMSDKKGKTVREYFSPIVGSKNYERVFSRLFRAVICQDPDEYPAQLFMKKRKEKVEGQPRRFSFKFGMDSLPNQIVQKDNLPVIKSNEVVKVQKMRAEQIFKILTLEGEVFYAKRLAIATNPQMAHTLLDKMDHPVSQLLNEINTSCCDSFSVLVDSNKIKLRPIAGIIPLSNDFMSAVSRDVVLDNNLRMRSFTFHFPKGTKTNEEKLNIICDVLKISPSDIMECREVSHILPALTTDDLGLAQKISEVRTDDNIFLLGNYFYGLALEDCVHRSFDEFQRFCTMD